MIIYEWLLCVVWPMGQGCAGMYGILTHAVILRPCANFIMTACCTFTETVDVFKFLAFHPFSTCMAGLQLWCVLAVYNSMHNNHSVKFQYEIMYH